MLTTTDSVGASIVLSTRDLNMRPEQDVAEIVGRFLRVGEAVVGHWVEFAGGLLLFVMAADDERSGEFYIYERRSGRFWLLSLPDEVFGGYSLDQMKQKMRDFRLLELAEDPRRLARCSH